MNAKEFKATALKCLDHYSVDFCTKKEMAILRKADYIELSHTEGWMWYRAQLHRVCA